MVLETLISSLIKVIRNFARGACGALDGRFFEMIAHDILRKGATKFCKNTVKQEVKKLGIMLTDPVRVGVKMHEFIKEKLNRKKEKLLKNA
ncbi:hypothetical protein F8M41_024209 [Gigaspora margarita]|uniref:Uncharacterized protein n=1 Tax=Gigaspora margarita TaxID=4874 RepID=A0A8H4EFI3_GIGMA|nr:hypothetical protein F8M41_024209 [Gigaspora margarita]